MMLHDAFAHNNAGRLAVQSSAFTAIVGWLIVSVEFLLRVARSAPVRLLCFDLVGVVPAQPYDDPVGLAASASPDALKLVLLGFLVAGIARLAVVLGKQVIQRKGVSYVN